MDGGLAAVGVGKSAEDAEAAGKAGGVTVLDVGQLDFLAERGAFQSFENYFAAGADEAGALGVVVAPAAADDLAEVTHDPGADVDCHQICRSRRLTV